MNSIITATTFRNSQTILSGIMFAGHNFSIRNPGYNLLMMFYVSVMSNV